MTGDRDPSSPLSVGVLHPTFESWGGAERFIHGVLRSLRRAGEFSAAVYTHRWRDPEDGGVAYRVHEHRSGGVRSGPWDWDAIARRWGPRWLEHDVLFVHNHPALEWAVRVPGHPPMVWYCHEPPRHVWDDGPAGGPGAGRDTASWRRLDAALSIYRWRLPGRAWSRLRLEASRRVRPDLWRRRLQAMDVRAVGRCNSILANSAFTAGEVRRIYRREAEVVYPLLPHLDSEESPVLQDKTRMVLWVGRLAVAKRPLLMLDAWERVASRFSDFRLVMVGAGPLEDEVKRRIEQLTEPRSVDLRSAIPGDELRELYGRAMLTVHLSDAEPFGLVPLESMWMGTPVLARCGGGVAETVVPDETGWCLDGGEPASVAEALLGLLGRADELTGMGDSVARAVRRRFGFRTTVGRISDVLRRAACPR